MGRITSLDVAEKAGVSRSAVSRVFTPGASVSKDTAAKVRRAAGELGYRPNVLARSLNTGQSRIIGLVVAYLENQFYPEAIEKLSKSLQKRGYHVLVFMASNDSESTQTVIEELLDYQVDGIIAASVGLGNDLTQRCAAAGIPVLLFNRRQEGARFSSVTSDNAGGGRQLAEFLLAGGHQRIGHIAGWEGASTQVDREAGFVSALRAAGTDLVAREAGNYHYAQAQAAARAMFDVDAPPDAVFVANDHMAFAVMDVLRFELGIDVPNDVSVVGFDDVPLSAWPTYDLTTVRQRANAMVAHTVDILLERIAAPQTAAHHASIDAPLIIRGSARLPEGQTP
ncbi:LacI family DNA-binding transcriptional regulator [uncultured Sulfitobacter sp.]|uniref:LacI family DNA-binding transcriptional regulator n=1 Tax=uncultured Sulfitobacter sp. TaxID=191468 RepID=UPI0026099A17|nr:LacI family DNA-binding transcriptional regulator [uncultured Sulfitobacter sp.]